MAARVARTDAERVLRALLKAGALDGARKALDRGADVLLPVRDVAGLATLVEGLGAALVPAPELAPREERPTPHEAICARVDPTWRHLVPDKWELLGDVVVVRIPDALRPHAREVAAAFAHVLGAKCVVEDASGVTGELRSMNGSLLFGDDPVATHVENGIVYRLDASRIMFSSGNVAERKRAGEIDAAGETVVDMFAGIGYFAIPLALRSGAARVVAIEKNPVSFAYLEENVRLNRVGRVVEPWLGDNRAYPRAGFADRVLMGYFPGCAKFLPTALALLKPQGGVVHYHDSAHAERWKEEMTSVFLESARACGRVVALEQAHVVKSYAPGVVHAVLVARVRGG